MRIALFVVERLPVFIERHEEVAVVVRSELPADDVLRHRRGKDCGGERLSHEMPGDCPVGMQVVQEESVASNLVDVGNAVHPELALDDTQDSLFPTRFRRWAEDGAKLVGGEADRRWITRRQTAAQLLGEKDFDGQVGAFESFALAFLDDAARLLHSPALEADPIDRDR
jgi:hypothetical protein